MTADSRAEQEGRAERCLRRGDLSEALRLLESLAAAFPNDPSLTARVAEIRGNLQPAELMHPKARAAAPEPAPLTAEQEGERLCALGDYAGAAAAYRRALAEHPDSELIRERLAELFALAQRSTGPQRAEEPLPSGREERMRALLDRISQRARVRRP